MPKTSLHTAVHFLHDESGKMSTELLRDDGAKFVPKFETSCYEKVVQGCSTQSSALFCAMAELVDDPREAKTFWLPADACPTTSLEKIAKAIFDYHIENLCAQRRCSQASTKDKGGGNRDTHGDHTASKVVNKIHADFAAPGAEWWVQRREEGLHSTLGMPFHWDKDEHILDEEGVVLCPAVSTVTYLTEHGAPTVVVEGGVQEGDFERAFVSYPALYKHLAFDGGFLHGVPEQLTRAGNATLRGTTEEIGSARARHPETGSTSDSIGGYAASERPLPLDRTRVTLLVNVWLSHKPKGVAPLPEALAASLRRRDLAISPELCFDRPVAFSIVPVDNEKEETLGRQQEAGDLHVQEAEWATMMINARLGPTLVLEMRAPTPERLSARVSKTLHSFLLVYRKWNCCRISAVHQDTATCVKSFTHAGGIEDDGSVEGGSDEGSRAESSARAAGTRGGGKQCENERMFNIEQI